MFPTSQATFELIYQLDLWALRCWLLQNTDIWYKSTGRKRPLGAATQVPLHHSGLVGQPAESGPTLTGMLNHLHQQETLRSPDIIVRREGSTYGKNGT